MEQIGKVQREFHESSGVWQTAATFADRERGIAILTRKSAFSVSGSIAAPLFQYESPLLGLREADRHFLAEALRRGSDEELAARMNLSSSTVKKRWQALFEYIAEVRPELMPAESRDGGKGSRGPQKRHLILSYVRAHPQELRPFRWRSATPGLSPATDARARE